MPLLGHLLVSSSITRQVVFWAWAVRPHKPSRNGLFFTSFSLSSLRDAPLLGELCLQELFSLTEGHFCLNIIILQLIKQTYVRQKENCKQTSSLSKILPLALRLEKGAAAMLGSRGIPQAHRLLGFVPESVQATTLDGSKQQASSNKTFASSSCCSVAAVIPHSSKLGTVTGR